MKDKRVKCCPNEACSHDLKRKKPTYSVEDRFCKSCGTELALACARCLGPLSDRGPKHKICERCEAEIADKKAKAKETGGKALAGAGAVALAVVKFIKKPH